MLTNEQEIWINHLSDTDIVSIVPFDATCETKFLKVKDIVQKILGIQQSVVHCGASSMGISGQDEIDIYVPVPPKDFDLTIGALEGLFGKPRSRYYLKRARFVMKIDEKHVDVFVVNIESTDWLNMIRFQDYLRSNLDALEEYRKLKETASGQSTRQYYRIKIEFINEILANQVSN